jgi:tRNA (mo5U34)-methyltransferase
VQLEYCAPVDDDLLQSRIASFDETHYRFVDFTSLGDYREPERSSERAARNELLANRHRQRSRYFFDRLLDLTDGTLQGHRVLDLGCNAGFWALKAAQAGADFVLGIDGREIHVDHAQLVFEAAGIEPDRYRFEVSNLFHYQRRAGEPPYDVVFCLGLLYHVAKPVELFEVMANAGAEIIVIDTEVSLSSGSMFQIYTEVTDARTNAVDYETVFYPTRQAVIDLATQFGYQCVPLALNVTDWRNMGNYQNHRRVAFIAARTASLSSLPREVPPLASRAGVLGEMARRWQRFGDASDQIIRRTRRSRLSQ